MGCFATGIIAGVPHAGALLAQDVPIAGDDEQPDPAQVQDEVGKRTEPEGEVATEEADRPGSPAYIAPENRDADSIYRQVFGKERPLMPAGEYSVIVDNINVGEYRMDPERDGGSVDARLLVAALIPIAIDETEAALRRLAEQPRVSFDELRSLDMAVNFDPGQLVLRVAIPPERRDARQLVLRGARNRATQEFAGQADTSAFVSVRAGLDLVERSTSQREGFRGFVADIDTGVNIGGVALQGRFRYDERRARKFSRRDVRLTYDDVERQIRYELGDLSVGRRPFQLAPRIAGISAYREFPIDPYRNIRPVSEQGFQLDEPARVDVYLNGAPVRTYELGSGRYNLRDIPLVPSAANDVELRLTYASGRVEVLAFPAFYDIELLEPGLVDFGFNAGVSYRDEDGRRVYDDGDYNVIGYVRKGLSPTLTAGLTWEGNRDFDTVGFDAVWASPIGSFAINSATNIRNPKPSSSRLALQYSWRDTDRARSRTIDAQVVMTGEDYQTLNRIFGGNNVKLSGQFRAGQSFGPKWRGQAYAGYEEARAFGERYYAGINLSHQFDFGTLSFGAEYQKSPEDSGPVVRLSYSMPLGSGNLSANYTSQDNAARAEYTRLAALGVGSIGAAAGIERRDDFDRQYARLSYIGNRFETGVEQARATGADGFHDLRTRLTFGSSLAMADGVVAVGRPISNSFAIVSVNEQAKDYRIAVEPRTGFGSSKTLYSAYSDWMGPAVVPTLTPYFNRSLQVDAPDAPAGISLGGQVFAIKPGYRSGYHLEVGSEANAALLGTLIDQDGEPIVFGIGEAVRVGSNEDAPIPLFTNGSGRFFLEGVVAGASYRLTISREDETIETVVPIPEGTVGILRLEDPEVIGPRDLSPGEVQ